MPHITQVVDTHIEHTLNCLCARITVTHARVCVFVFVCPSARACVLVYVFVLARACMNAYLSV